MKVICVSGLVLGFLTVVALGNGEDGEVIELESILVTPSPFALEKEDLVSPASELSGEDLRRAAGSSLGSTLDGEPGVHSTYHGPGAGRPVIRGFGGDRVRILNQGIDTFDVSETSPDHGVGVEPLFAERVEVVRGPASLLYGSAAIGGVVNVLGKELPREPAQDALEGEFAATFASVSNETSFGLALRGGDVENETFAWSFGYMDRDADNMEIPSLAESVYLLEPGEEEEFTGELENSFVETQSGYLGFGWFSENTTAAFAFSGYASDYGVPGHAHGHGEEHGHEDEEHEEEEYEEEHHEEEEHGDEESVAINLDQSRFSGRFDFRETGEWFESVELLFGYGEYRHMEIEGDEIGTVFRREGGELRATAVHKPIGSWTGALGLHLKDESFSAEGEEAFIPTNDEISLGLFLVERLNRDWGSWEFGGRLEGIEIKPEGVDLKTRRFTTASASAGFAWAVEEGSVFSSNLSFAQRAPNASELFAFGPHLGTRSFEIGNRRLDEESSINLDVSFRRSIGRVTGELTVFYSDFSDYIYLAFLDDEDLEVEYPDLDTEGLSVFRARASDASFYGYEAEFSFHLLDTAEDRMHIDLLVDQTRATNDSLDTNLPRIPARRVGVRLEQEKSNWSWGIEGRWVDSASHLAPYELPTDSYVLAGADFRYTWTFADGKQTDLFLVGRNLFDEEARAHTSFLKDLAPLPGRDLRVGLRTRW